MTYSIQNIFIAILCAATGLASATELTCPDSVVQSYLCERVKGKDDAAFFPVLIILKFPDSLVDSSTSKDPKVEPPSETGKPGLDSARHAFLKERTTDLFTRFDLRSRLDSSIRLGLPSEIWKSYGPLWATKKTIQDLRMEPFMLSIEFGQIDPMAIVNIHPHARVGLQGMANLVNGVALPAGARRKVSRVALFR